MKFVVYHKDTGELFGMYGKESSAKARCTRHNRLLMMAILSNKLRQWEQDREGEWAYCSWQDYEPIFFQWYAISNRFSYNGHL